MLTPLTLEKPASLVELATNRLREAIVSGRFKPGERLVEASLSASFGISRAPLREALRILGADGLIESRQGRGTYVISPSTDQLEHMILARASAEGVAARLLAATRPAKSLQRLQHVLDEQRRAREANDEAGLVRHHWNFHQALCEESRNPHLLQIWSNVSNVLRIYSAAAVYKLALTANSTFLRFIREASPAEAEALLRSQIMFTSYVYIRRPVPEALLDYVNQYIDPEGKVVLMKPEAVNATLLAFEAQRTPRGASQAKAKSSS